MSNILIHVNLLEPIQNKFLKFIPYNFKRPALLSLFSLKGRRGYLAVHFFDDFLRGLRISAISNYVADLCYAFWICM